jgi:hypothetical protein
MTGYFYPKSGWLIVVIGLTSAIHQIRLIARKYKFRKQKVGRCMQLACDRISLFMTYQINNRRRSLLREVSENEYG